MTDDLKTRVEKVKSELRTSPGLLSTRKLAEDFIDNLYADNQRLEQENAALREGSISPWFPYPEHVPELRQAGGLPPLSLPILFFSVDDYLYPSIRFGSFQEGKFTSFNNITYPKVILWREIEYMEGLILVKQALAAKGGEDGNSN